MDERGAHAAIVEFARDLARRIDRVGMDEAPLALVKAYQSALKDLQRAAVRLAPRPGRDLGESVPSVPTPSSPAQLHAVEESPLAKLRRKEAERAAKRSSAAS